MKEILTLIFAGRSLTQAQAAQSMRQILDGQVPIEQSAAFLGALRAKGETPEEIAGLVQVLLDRAIPLECAREPLLDCCGTGGDQSGSFNISTAAAFVLAGAGAVVAKHGNRSVSSRSGSADVLEALGVPTDLPPEVAKHRLEQEGFCFLLAPRYHRDLAGVAALRKAIGVPTVFNLLGPLCNPARVRRQVLGVYDSKMLETLARALERLGTQEALVVASECGLDELSLSGKTQAVHLKNGTFEKRVFTPEDAGLARAPREALLGGDARRNAEIIEAILTGKELGPPRDVVALNAGAGLWIAGLAKDLRSGVALALETIASGAAARSLEQARRQA